MGQAPDAPLSVAELARLVARADVLEALVGQGLSEEALPLATALRASLRAALAAAQGDGAAVLKLDAARARGRGKG